MNQNRNWQQLLKYEPESWRDEKSTDDEGMLSLAESQHLPTARDQTRCFELLGKVNYKIIHGNRVYVEVGGVVYKTLFGGYWRSVFTGVEHYLLRCEQVSGSVWAEDGCTGAVDLPIAYADDAWSASGHSISFMLSRE
jgi:hypothetical protein